MASRAVLVALVALLATTSWPRLESIVVSWREWLPMLLFALPPSLAVALLRSRLALIAVLAGSAIFAASAAYEIPLGDARPQVFGGEEHVTLLADDLPLGEPEDVLGPLTPTEDVPVGGHDEDGVVLHVLDEEAEHLPLPRLLAVRHHPAPPVTCPRK